MQNYSPQKQTVSCSTLDKGCVTWNPGTRIVLLSMAPDPALLEPLWEPRTQWQVWMRGCRLNLSYQWAYKEEFSCHSRNRIPHLELLEGGCCCLEETKTQTQQPHSPKRNPSCFPGQWGTGLRHAGCGGGARRTNFIHVVLGFYA